MKHPSVIWTAEFSDPLSYSTDGQKVQGTIPLEWLKEKGFITAMEEAGISLDLSEDSYFSWCEIITSFFADKLIFTNQNQLEYMLSYIKGERLKEIIVEKAIISHHPSPKEWYQRLKNQNPFIERRKEKASKEKIRIGYFGSFYKERNLNGLLTSIKELPDEDREKITLEIYSVGNKDAYQVASELELTDTIICKPPLSYPDFLKSLELFDILLINDISTETHEINPYLPSKLSDYAASPVPILALYDTDSPLSKSTIPKYKACITKPEEAEQNITAALYEIIKAMDPLEKEKDPSELLTH